MMRERDGERERDEILIYALGDPSSERRELPHHELARESFRCTLQ